MKTQQQAQKIFDVLVEYLKFAQELNLSYVTRDLRKEPTALSPLEEFLESVRKDLTKEDIKEDIDEMWLRQVYAEAFRTGPIPKNRNHILMTCDLQLNSGLRSEPLTLWVDLDKIAHQLNTYLPITPPYRFKVEYDCGRECGYKSNGNLFEHRNYRFAVNSLQQDPSFINNNFLFGCILVSVSVYALLITALAVASIITLSTAGIGTAVGLVAGLACYNFFKARPDTYTTVVPIIEESPSENIQDIFSKHFVATIRSHFQQCSVPNVEIIELQQLALGR